MGEFDIDVAEIFADGKLDQEVRRVNISIILPIADMCISSPNGTSSNRNAKATKRALSRAKFRCSSP